MKHILRYHAHCDTHSCLLSFHFFPSFAGVRRPQVHGIIFNVYVCLGVASVAGVVAIVLAALGRPLFSPLCIVGGVLFGVGTMFGFVALGLVGLGTAQGAWFGSGVLVSFLWGACGPKEIRRPLRSVPMCSVAMVVLVGGVVGAVFCNQISAKLWPKRHRLSKPLLDTGAARRASSTNIQGAAGSGGGGQATYYGSVGQEDRLVHPEADLQSEPPPPSEAANTAAGLVCAVLAGSMGASNFGE